MYTALAIFASILGLFVTGAALFTAWFVHQERKPNPSQQELDPAQPSDNGTPVDQSRALLQRWMVWDWAVIMLFGAGAVFLFTDLLAVSRDRAQYPPYHYGYLLCGFIFCIMGMLFAFIRILTLLSLNRGSRAPGADHSDEPEHAYHAEDRV
jgi:hypothetical protein